MVQRKMDGPGQQGREAPPAEGNLRKANSGMALNVLLCPSVWVKGRFQVHC